MNRLRCLGLGGLLFAGAWQASAAGLACRQDCSTGRCDQVSCDLASGSGSCECGGAALGWGENTYSAWCRTWRRPLPAAACPHATPAEDYRGRPLPPPKADLTNPGALAMALAARNPYAATLVNALLDGERWVEGPSEGLLHDTSYDPETGVLTHTAALPFSAQVLAGGLDAAQIQIKVGGDMTKLFALRTYAMQATPMAVAPLMVSGIVTEGGLHGALQVTAIDGKSETIQW